MKSCEIREKFLNYFEKNGHTIEPSSSLVPYNDESILFVNAGMVPFKDVFIGSVKRDDKRAVSCQRCIRAGGKHNDLENVGYTARHHTFFEMLGNFSFGDYFKNKAIFYAWDFLTKELKLSKEKLWVSIFEDDDESFDIWTKEIGFPANKISRCKEKDNFWQMGATGPCGPCSEIFYDYGEHIAGGPPGTPEEDGDRFVEVWNLVFMQYNRQEDGTLTSLENPGIDTGMGLERITSILQNKNNNYDIDTFREIIAVILSLTPKDKNITHNNSSVKVIADHIRSTTFMIVDGIIPANEGRGYVLRRIIRRAIRHGHNIGIKDVFFYKLAKILAKQYENYFVDISTNLKKVEKTLIKEEKRFIKTLDSGMDILESTMNNLKGKTIDGDTIFKLYDTYGFPVDLTADIAREKGLSIDIKGFEKAMQEQKNRARKAGEFKVNLASIVIDDATEFCGYDLLSNTTNINTIIKDGKIVDFINHGEEAVIILNKSSFYGESGGQVGDTGIINTKDAEFVVKDTQKQKSNAFEHYGYLKKGRLSAGDFVEARVDSKRRNKIMSNHSATHLMHQALKDVLGNDVEQKGSLVEADKLRFDFSYDQAISKQDLDKIEEIVNKQIINNGEVRVEHSDIKTAQNNGAISLFGEKYDDIVRALYMGDDNFSIELCGGTHVNRLGDIGRFKILSESSIAAGVRRIEATTGLQAYKLDKEIDLKLEKIAKIIKSNSTQVVDKISQLVENNKLLERQLNNFKKQSASTTVLDLISKAKDINSIKLVNSQLTNLDIKELSSMADKLKDKLDNVIVVLASSLANKVVFVVGVSKSLTKDYKASFILDTFAQYVDGKGGGRDDIARGSGMNAKGIQQGFDAITKLINDN